MMKEGTNRRTYGVILLGTIISCFIAFYNNYPLVYPDTGSYLHSGWDNVVFLDRTIFYGLFLFEASFGSSVILMVFFQAWMVCYLLFKTLGIFFEGLQLRALFLGLVLFTTIFTGFSYNVSILIPDIFASITLLAAINLLLNQRLNVFESILISVLFIFSICTQLSAIPILSFTFALAFIFVLWRKMRAEQAFVSFKRLLIVSGLAASTLVIIPSVHYYYDGQYKISGGNHVFLINHLFEIGVLEEYLQDNCDQKDYKICAYKDSIAILGWDFMWSEKSPLQRTGGWEVNRKEYKTIIIDILTDKRYFWKVVRKSVEYSFKQFFTFQTTVSPPLVDRGGPIGQVQWRLPDTTKEYLSSKQSSNTLNLGFVNTVEMPVILFSLVALLFILLSPTIFNMLGAKEKWFSVIVVVYTIGSAVMCSNLSTIHPRFQNRIVWLLPIVLVVIGLKLREKRANIQAEE